MYSMQKVTNKRSTSVPIQVPGIRERITNMNPDYYFPFTVDFIGSYLNQLYSYAPPVNFKCIHQQNNTTASGIYMYITSLVTTTLDATRKLVT
jgi:hypothetical protein